MLLGLNCEIWGMSSEWEWVLGFVCQIPKIRKGDKWSAKRPLSLLTVLEGYVLISTIGLNLFEGPNNMVCLDFVLHYALCCLSLQLDQMIQTRVSSI